jgi:hypothetical protein
VNVVGGTLGGTGVIKGPVTIQSGGRLAPGSSIGALTISNSLTLSGQALMELNAALGTNDVVRGLSSVAYGGTLVLSNVAGTITASNAFKLFSASSYGGGFATVTPISPGLGLAWNTNTLMTDGTLRVLSTAPVTITNTLSAGILKLSWPADHIGWHLQSQTDPTSVGLGTNWMDVPNSILTNQVTLTISATAGSVFYRLAYP